jgi:hypothetical protein
MSKPTQPFVLDRHWDVSSLMGETFKLFWRYKWLFLAITAIIAVPYVVAVNLIWGEELADETAPFRWESTVVPGLLSATVVPALITALHVVSLLRIADGVQPSVGEAFGLAADRVGPVIGASLVYIVAVAVGLVLLIVPGIYLATSLYFAAQAAVVDGLGPVAAARRSHELVRGRWWQTFGRLLLAGLVIGLLTIPLAIPLALVEFGVVYVLVDVVIESVVLSLMALFGTLVFMDYHGHRAQEAAEPAGYGGFEPPHPPDAPRFG